MTTPHYKIIEVGGKNLVVFYPQFKDDEGYKIIDLENRFPIELKNEEEYKMFLEAIIASEDAIKDDLKSLADLIDEMSLLAKGPKGDTRFMWVKYADDDKGSGMSDNPDGKKYIGMAFNKDTETPSNNASDYTWARYYPDLTGIKDELREVEESLNSHTNNTNNPHSVTKSQVGLGNVQNYGIALESQAKVGVANNVYMTPLRTKQAIDANLEGAVFVVDSDIQGQSGYIKYSSGIMECWDRVKLERKANARMGAVWRFPEEFSRLPNVSFVMDGRQQSTTPSTFELAIKYIRELGMDYTELALGRIYGGTNFAEGDVVYVFARAIGRWD